MVGWVVECIGGWVQWVSRWVGEGEVNKRGLIS